MKTARRERYTDQTDEVLVQCVMQHDVDAFEVLYDRHASKLYALLRRMVHDKHAAEELLQETFWCSWQKAEQYSGAGTCAAWLHCIARNKALDHLRRQKVCTEFLVATLEPFEALPQLQEQSMQQAFEQKWTRQQVQQALTDIPTEQRLCLQLAYFEGLTHQAIAQQTHTPLGTIKTRVRSGMQKMVRALHGAGYSPSTA